MRIDKLGVFVFCLIISIFILNKIRMDNKGVKIWEETNSKLDKIINLLEK